MSVAVLDRQHFLGDIFGDRSVRPADGASPSTRAGSHGGLTLDDLIIGVWEGLAVRESVRCPACGGTMVSRSAAVGGVSGHEGDCRDCGATLY
jgi:hypothetical protein